LTKDFVVPKQQKRVFWNPSSKPFISQYDSFLREGGSRCHRNKTRQRKVIPSFLSTGSSSPGCPSSGGYFASLFDTKGPAQDGREHDPVLSQDDEGDNVMLTLLTTEYRSLWNTAFEENLIVCVPQAVSLHPNVSKDDVETHVFRPSKHIAGEYDTFNGPFPVPFLSLSCPSSLPPFFPSVLMILPSLLPSFLSSFLPPGKRVALVGNDLLTRSGFREERKVRVMLTEEVSHPAFPHKRVSILHISRPLAGGVDAPEAEEEINRAMIKRYVGILRAFPEHETVFYELDQFIRKVGISASKGEFDKVKPSLQECVSKQWRKAVKALAKSECFNAGSKSRSGNSSSKRRNTHLIQQVVESYIMEEIHQYVYPWFQNIHYEADLKVGSIFRFFFFFFSFSTFFRSYVFPFVSFPILPVFFIFIFTVLPFSLFPPFFRVVQFSACVEALKHRTQQDLGILPAFQCPLYEAVDELLALQVGALSVLIFPTEIIFRVLICFTEIISCVLTFLTELVFAVLTFLTELVLTVLDSFVVH
jgi:hypothetical protein